MAHKDFVLRILTLVGLVLSLIGPMVVAMPALAAPTLDTVTFSGPELLGKPTDTSITINIVPDATIEYYYEYGTSSGSYSGQTTPETAVGGQPHEVVITGLIPNTRYYYRMVYDGDGDVEDGDYEVRPEYTFQTQRAEGESFVFTVTADSHGNFGTNTATNILNNSPDFNVDLGDTFMVDSGLAETQSAYNGRYEQWRGTSYFGGISPSVPVFLMMGNHEEEEGWNFDDTPSRALLNIEARKLYFPMPNDDGFYSASTETHAGLSGDQLRENYYAWEWGDTLFVVIDPFQHTMNLPYNPIAGEESDETVDGDQWSWTLGIEQYTWLKTTLENSDAKYKFVFSHNMVGGVTTPGVSGGPGYVRGGAEAAGYFEWGGYNGSGVWEWDTERPSAEGWDVPIQQLFTENGVSAYFHGHDHQFVYETRDGVVYQLVPQTSTSGSGFGGIYTEGDFTDYYGDYSTIEILPNGGHLRITVAPTVATVDYIAASGGGVNYSYTIAPNQAPTDPTITIAGTPLSNFSSEPGTPSAEQSYTVSGINLTDDISITAPADFEVSTTSGSGFDSSLVLSESGGEVAATDIYVRFNRADEGTSSGEISHTSTDATTRNVAVSGTAVIPGTITLDGDVSTATADGVDSISVGHTTGTGDNRLMLVGLSVNNYSTEPTIDSVTFSYDSTDLPLTLVGEVDYEGRHVAIYGLVDPPNGQAGTVEVEFSEEVGYGMVAGVANFAGVDQTTPWGTFVSASDQSDTPSVDVTGLTGNELVFDTVFIGAATIPTLTPGADQTELWNATDNRAGGAASTEEATGSSVTMSWTTNGTDVYWAIGAVPINPAAAGPPSPSITITGTPLSSFSSEPGTPSAEQSYTVSGSNLTDDISITAPADFEISLTSGSGFGSSLILTQSGGEVAATTIYVRFNRATEGTSSGDITHTSAGATQQDVAVSGTAAVPTPGVSLDGAVSSGTADATDTISVGHTTGTSVNRLMMVGISANYYNNDYTITSVIFNDGTTDHPLTEVGHIENESGRLAAIYSLLDPPNGATGTVIVTFSGTVDYGIVVGVANFAGVDQSDPLDDFTSAVGTEADAISVDVPTDVDDLVFDTVFLGAADVPDLTTDASQTALWNLSGDTRQRGAGSIEEATASTTPMSWTASGGSTTYYWAIAAVPINPAPAGTTYELTMAVDPPEGGTAEPTVGVHTYAEGTTVAITATANSGYEFDHWEGDVANSGSVTTTVMMDSDKLVTAHFVESGEPPVTFQVRVVQSSDDAEEDISDGSVDLDSTDLELIHDTYYDIDQVVGMRFQSVGVPPGATIHSAYIEFETDETSSDSTSLTIYGQAADDPPTFEESANDISSRPQTLASVSWAPDAWDAEDVKHQTEDLATIVQEIVDRGGWVSGNAMVFIVEGSGQRVAEAYDGEAENAPLLVIEYSESTEPNIIVTGIPLAAFSSEPGMPSAEQSYTVSGSNLTEDIAITAPADFEISLTSGSGFASSLTLPQSGGSVVATAIYVRFNRATEGTSSGNITHTSAGATTRNVAVSGEAALLQALPILEGDNWRYFKGTEEPGAGWNEVGFDDSSWLEGPSGFGYGDDDDATVLDDMEDEYISLYVRKEFTVADPSLIAGLVLSMDYDDGFVAYLNGSEIARDNVSGTPPAFDAAADSNHEASGGGSGASPVETYDIDPGLLVAGTNVLAVQGHNRELGSSDFSLIPTLEEAGAGPTVVSFREGEDGYSGTVDTFIMESDADTSYGGEDWVEWDNDDPYGSGESNFGLIRFDGIFGSGADQIPVGVTIESATLTYVVDDTGDPADVNEVVVDWAEDVTYNGFGDDPGVQADEYGASVGTASGDSGAQTIDVTASLIAWASDPAANHGWVFRPTDSGGVEFHSSEYATLADRPLLEVTYSTGGPVNQAPDQPTLIQPLDGATDVSTSPTLEVTVTDPDDDMLDVTFYGREVGTTSPGEDFTIIALPDTQMYAQSYPTTFTAQTQWIVDNQDDLNIVYVAHEGDIVNTASSTTQWDNADAAMSLLEDPVTTGLTDGIPYGVVPGNHDTPTGNYNTYFGVSRFEGRSYYGGHYDTTNDNNYTLFSAGGMDFIVVNLEYQPGTTELDWADALLTSYSDRRAIVVSHSIIDYNNSWTYQAIYTALQDNPNLFLMLCGHMHTSTDGAGQRTETGDNGNTIYVLMADYQDYPNGGNGYLRIMRFSPANDRIYVETYSPTLPGNLTDAENQFDLAYTMEGSGSFEVLGTVSSVASGGNAAIIWPDLDPDTEYEWYVEVSDSSITTTGSTWDFITEPAAPTCYALTLGHTGQGSDPVASPTNSVGCPAGQYVAGEVISLSGATPDMGWHIAGWTGTDDDASTAGTNTVTMPAGAHTASVTYVKDTVTLTVSVVGNGSVSKDPDQATYEYGDEVELTATADPGWTFDDWSGDVSSSDNPLTITITSDTAITATFTQDEYTLTVNVVGDGAVTVDPDQATYQYGDEVELTATADPGWTFAGWSGDVSSSDSPLTITITSDTSVTATFTPESGILGDVNGDGLVNSTDALIILSCDAGIDTSQFCPMNCGDVNADGLVNSTDALIVLSYDAGMEVPYPVGEPGCPSSVTPCPGCSP